MHYLAPEAINIMDSEESIVSMASDPKGSDSPSSTDKTLGPSDRAPVRNPYEPTICTTRGPYLKSYHATQRLQSSSAHSGPTLRPLNISGPQKYVSNNCLLGSF